MLAGGLTIAVPGVMPEAMAANANLYVSAAQAALATQPSQCQQLAADPQTCGYLEAISLPNQIYPVWTDGTDHKHNQSSC
jgi:hypothetical protein